MITGWFDHRIGLVFGPGWRFELLGLSVGGRPVYLAGVALGLLLLTMPMSLYLGGEIRTRWTTWSLILPVVGIPLWLGTPATVALAVALAFGAVLEYTRLTGLARVDSCWLLASAVALPVVSVAGSAGGAAAWVPWLVLGGAGLPLLAADAVDGFRRATMMAFAVVWLCWSPANLPLLGRDAFVVLFAAACADVGAFVGGVSLRRFSWAAHRLTPLSPGKTWGGVAGALVSGAAVLFLCGTLSVGWLLAVWGGGIVGDLLESMLKRQQRVKDAGAWLPGFGGLLDRVDSLLVAVPLAVLLAGR